MLKITNRGGGAVVISGTVIIEDNPITFGALTTAAMGNGAPAEVVAANSNRRELWICNISDTTGYFSFGDGTGLTTTTYIFMLLPGQVMIIEPPTSGQAIAADCGAAGKNIAYQEAV